MIYEFKFSTQEDPEEYKMVIEADTRSDLLYNILNKEWDTDRMYFDDDDRKEIMENIFDRLLNPDLKTYASDLYDFLTRAQFKLDLRRFMGENNNESLERLLNVFGQTICQFLGDESGGLDFGYEFLKR